MFTDILSKQLCNFVCNSRKKICLNKYATQEFQSQRLMNDNKHEIFIMKVPNYISRTFLVYL